MTDLRRQMLMQYEQEGAPICQYGGTITSSSFGRKFLDVVNLYQYNQSCEFICVHFQLLIYQLHATHIIYFTNIAICESIWEVNSRSLADIYTVFLIPYNT